MNISINIQSYNRAEKQDTLKIIHKANLWVHKFEIDNYVKHNPAAKIIELPDELCGNLSKIKNYILEKEKDNEVIVFLDDDLKCIKYHEGGANVEIKEDRLINMIEKYTILCQEWGFKLWGIQVNADKMCYREYSPFSTVSYVSSSFSCFLKSNNIKYDEQFTLKEDYDMTIMQCNENRGLLRVNKYYYVKKSAENIGGCAMYRNIEKEKEQMKLLQKKWGSKIVKEDNYKSRNHKTNKKRGYDINPIIHIPIKGI